MQIIKRKNGTTFKEEVRLPDGRRLTKTFKRKTDAGIWKRKIQSEIDQGKVFGQKVFDKVKFQDYSLKWLKNKVEPRRAPSTCYRYKYDLEQFILPVIGNIHLSEIKRSHGDNLVSFLRERGNKPKAINNVLGVLKTILAEAVREEFLEKNPLQSFGLLKEPPRTPLYWSKLEISQFLRANLNDPLYPLYVLALNTGLRRGELCGLCWDRIDFTRNLLEVSRTRDRYGLRETTKSGKRRHVPINRDARHIFEEIFRKQIDPKFVFMKAPGQPVNPHHLYREFDEAQERAGLEKKIRFHDLRHTFASQFIMSGGHIYDLQKILGHSSVSMTQIYAHLSPDHLANTTSILSFNGNRVESKIGESSDSNHLPLFCHSENFKERKC